MSAEDLEEVHREAQRAANYRRFIEYERSVGLAYVSLKLDQLCLDLGMEPMTVWRVPRIRERGAA